MSTSTEFLTRPSGLSFSDYYLHRTGAAVETVIRDDRRVILRSLKNFAWITWLALTVPALVAGLFASMLVRELDCFWDQVTHGFCTPLRDAHLR